MLTLLRKCGTKLASSGIGPRASIEGLRPVVIETSASISRWRRGIAALFVPQETQAGDEPISVLHLVTSTPRHVISVSGAVLSVLGVDDVSKINVQASE